MLRPEFWKVRVTGGEVRYGFGLLRPDRTRKVYAHVQFTGRRSYPGTTFQRPLGVSFEIKVFA